MNIAPNKVQYYTIDMELLSTSIFPLDTLRTLERHQQEILREREEIAGILRTIILPELAAIIEEFLFPETISNEEMIAAASVGDYRMFIRGMLQCNTGIYRAFTAAVKARQLDMLKWMLSFIERWLFYSYEIEKLHKHIIEEAMIMGCRKYAWVIWELVNPKDADKMWRFEWDINIPYKSDKESTHKFIKKQIALFCRHPITLITNFIPQNGSVKEDGTIDIYSTSGLILYLQLHKSYDELERLTHHIMRITGNNSGEFIGYAAWDARSFEYLSSLCGGAYESYSIYGEFKFGLTSSGKELKWIRDTKRFISSRRTDREHTIRSFTRKLMETINITSHTPEDYLRSVLNNVIGDNIKDKFYIIATIYGYNLCPPEEFIIGNSSAIILELPAYVILYAARYGYLYIDDERRQIKNLDK